jgi:membrane-associated phospholipid phosphatase
MPHRYGSRVSSRTARLLALAAAGVAAFAVLLVAAYYVGVVTRLDARLFEGLRNVTYPGRALNPVRRMVELGDTAAVVAILVSIGVAGLLAGRRREVLAALLIVVTSAVASQVLQVALAHPRYPVGGAPALPDTSYPSGHATLVMATALGAIVVAPGRWRPVVAICGLAYVLIVSAGLVADGWHYPSDVVGGYLVAVVTAVVAIALLRIDFELAPREPAMGPELEAS